MEVSIRRAHISDAASCAEAHVRSWHEAYRGLIPDDVIASRNIELRRTQWLEWLHDPQRVTYVAMNRAGDIVGFAMAQPYSDEPSFDVQLSALHVVQSAQRAGVGRALVVETAYELSRRGFSALTLNVISDNVKARRFYEHLGAQFIREAKMHGDDQTWIDAVYGWDDIAALAGRLTQ